MKFPSLVLAVLGLAACASVANAHWFRGDTHWGVNEMGNTVVVRGGGQVTVCFATSTDNPRFDFRVQGTSMTFVYINCRGHILYVRTELTLSDIASVLRKLASSGYAAAFQLMWRLGSNTHGWWLYPSPHNGKVHERTFDDNRVSFGGVHTLTLIHVLSQIDTTDEENSSNGCVMADEDEYDAVGGLFDTAQGMHYTALDGCTGKSGGEDDDGSFLYDFVPRPHEDDAPAVDTNADEAEAVLPELDHVDQEVEE